MAELMDNRDWTQRWPAGAKRVEVRAGRLVFEVHGSDKRVWTDVDVATAQRCYPGQPVTLSGSRTRLFVDPPGGVCSEPVLERASRRDDDDSAQVPAAPGASGSRRVIRVSADQVSAARGLVRLRGGLDKVPPLIAKVAQARPVTR